MADHRDLLNFQVHEPKHISDSDSADAGKVITPSSGGASELRNLTPSEVGISFAHGQIEIDDIDTADAFSVSAATADTGLHDAADYILVNSTRVVATSDNLYNITFNSTNVTLEVTIDGVYEISGWFNVSSDTTNSKIGIRYTANGTVNGAPIITDVKETDRTQNFGGFGQVELTSGTEVGFSIACDKNADITIRDARLNLKLIREI